VIRRRVAVRGHVQGVFFRETTRRRALAEGLTGWVRNQPDGSVEAVFEGERESVERLVAFVREGPRGARVDWVDVVSDEPEGLDGFEIRRAASISTHARDRLLGMLVR
jgi:acylphosphatase